MANEPKHSSASARRSWNPNMFLAHRAELNSLLASPPQTPPPVVPSGNSSLADTAPTTGEPLQRQSLHRRGTSSVSEWSRSGHARTNSTFSVSQHSQFSSPASSVSRPRTPDSLDSFLSGGFFDSEHDKYSTSKRPLSGIVASSTKTSTNSTNRWSTSSSALRQISEQERMLQEKLQQLARSDNARLKEFESASSTPSSAVNSRPVSFVAPGPPEKRNSINIAASFKHAHQRNLSLQPYFNSNDQVPELIPPQQSQRQSGSPLRSPITSPVISPVMSSNRSATPALKSPIAKSFAAKEAARAAALAQLSGVTETKTSRKSAAQKLEPLVIPKEDSGNKRQRSLQSPGYLIISDTDLEKLGKDKEKAVTTRPSAINGSALSWQMAGDIVQTSGKAYKSPQSLVDMIRFLWVMFSNPAFVKDISISDSKFLPPAELIENFKESIMLAITQATLQNIMDSLLAIGKLAGAGVCTALAFMIIFIQVSLLSTMVIAYVLGDLITSPFKFTNKWLNSSKVEPKDEPNEEITPEEQAKASALKVQRAARKAIRNRSKRRSRHHN